MFCMHTLFSAGDAGQSLAISRGEHFGPAEWNIPFHCGSTPMVLEARPCRKFCQGMGNSTSSVDTRQWRWRLDRAEHFFAGKREFYLHCGSTPMVLEDRPCRTFLPGELEILPPPWIHANGAGGHAVQNIFLPGNGKLYLHCGYTGMEVEALPRRAPPVA